jgi:PKD repeat protein
MNRMSTLKWTAVMVVAAMSIFSCGSEDPSPTAAFTITGDSDDYRTFTFQNNSKDATSFEWNFGDGSAVSTEENPTHTFGGPGYFTVTLKAKNGGSEVTKSEGVTVTPVLTDKVLNGNGAKSWKLKAAGGAFIVGETIGNGDWYPGNTPDGLPKDLSGERPCLFNDEFIFKTGGVFEYDANGDIWSETYMGYSGGEENKCQEEGTLPEAAASWGSGEHTYTFTKGAGGPDQITVTGTGAFIVLPKAKNGSEYSAAPPAQNGSVTYDVVSYNFVEDTETLVITIDIGPGYWTFTLIHEND